METTLTREELGELHLLAQLAALIPVLAYPFMDSDDCAHILHYTAMVNMLVFHFLNHAFWSRLHVWIEFPLWVTALAALTFMASHVRLYHEWHQKFDGTVNVQPKNFRHGAYFVVLISFTGFIVPGTLDMIDSEYGERLGPVGCLQVASLVGMSYINLLLHSRERILSFLETALYRFIMRDFPLFFWLPKEEKQGKDARGH